MQGTSLTKQERECKLYDAFDKFTHIKGESLHKYYLRFTQQISDMNIYNMKMEQFQVNTKFLNSLPPEWSKFVTNVKLVKDLHTTNFDQLHAYLEQHKLHANELPLVDSGHVVPVFSPGDDPIACLNKAIAFITVVTSSSYKSNATSSRGNNASGQARVVKCYNYQAEAQEARQILDEEQLAFLTDPGNAKSVLMGNISNYGSDVVSEVPHSETYLNDMENQSVDAIQDFKQTSIVDVTDNKITSDSNIILYSQYLQETQETNEKANKEQNNELVTAELERYKERVKTFEQRLNIDLSGREKMIDSQIDDMIKEKLALKEQVDSLEQNLSKQIKEKELEVPSELPKASLVNASLKKLKFHLAQFDYVVKKRTTHDARTEVKGKEIIDITAQILSANTIVPGMFKLNLDPLAPRLLQNREAHIDYLKYTQEQADIL
ncbi:hypothetical protein Tco_0895100 [Tanacetum coccineum]|uniref:Integrase, catalytic region, zinc finger, CCHC-type, peptidase aspartic, catalytic n=1 Tax=Tanacetum coccineum TaxID=301880 RepID=A0ABQ5CEU6_9ASTR